MTILPTDDLTPDPQLTEQGVRPGGSTEMVVTGYAMDWDVARNRVLVSFKGEPGRWFPGLPGFYAKKRTVFVLRNPLTSEYVLVLGPTVGYPAQVVASVTSVDTVNVRATVTMVDGTVATLPYTGTAPTAGGQAWVALDPSLYGNPYLVIGPAVNPPAAVQQPVPVLPTSAQTFVTRTATILPSWSGTWRGDTSRWNAYNASRYGADTLWQGSGSNVTGAVGLATYGTRITELGATQILSGSLLLRGADAASDTYPAVTVQCATNGTQPAGAPTAQGTDTITGNPGRAGTDQPVVTAAMLEALRTGAARGVILVGSQLAAVRGTGAPDGMALTLTYKTPA